MEASPNDKTRRVGIVTTSRADFGIYSSIFKEVMARGFDAGLYVSGDHIPKGNAANPTKLDDLSASAGLPVFGHVEMETASDDAAAVARAMGNVTQGFADVLAHNTPDILLVLGDRFEMHAVVVAATGFRIPVAHIHGGEESEGAIDNVFRHSITKLSHLHFCATELSRKRIASMGEEPFRIHISGAPSLDGITDGDWLTREELGEELSLPNGPFLLGTFHPETMDIEKSLTEFEALMEALASFGVTTIFSRANADEGGQEINRRLEARANSQPWLRVFGTLGRKRYFSAMKYAHAMVGNSSSGIIEAASFDLPVINVGDRQGGRERSLNTLDIAANKTSLLNALNNISEIRSQTANVYGAGNAAQKICDVLETIPLDKSLLIKRFTFSD